MSSIFGIGFQKSEVHSFTKKHIVHSTMTVELSLDLFQEKLGNEDMGKVDDKMGFDKIARLSFLGLVGQAIISFN